MSAGPPPTDAATLPEQEALAQPATVHAAAQEAVAVSDGPVGLQGQLAGERVDGQSGGPADAQAAQALGQQQQPSQGDTASQWLPPPPVGVAPRSPMPARKFPAQGAAPAAPPAARGPSPMQDSSANTVPTQAPPSLAAPAASPPQGAKPVPLEAAAAAAALAVAVAPAHAAAPSPPRAAVAAAPVAVPGQGNAVLPPQGAPPPPTAPVAMLLQGTVPTPPNEPAATAGAAGPGGASAITKALLTPISGPPLGSPNASTRM